VIYRSSTDIPVAYPIRCSLSV